MNALIIVSNKIDKQARFHVAWVHRFHTFDPLVYIFRYPYVSNQ